MSIRQASDYLDEHDFTEFDDVQLNFDQELTYLLDLLIADEIEYAICGGLAVVIYGYPRFTRDIDLLIPEADLDRVLSSIKKLNYTVPGGLISFNKGTSREINVYRISKVVDEEFLSLDLVLVSHVLQTVWDERVVFEWQNRQITVVSLTGLAKMKQLAGRTQDRLDLEKLGLADDQT